MINADIGHRRRDVDSECIFIVDGRPLVYSPEEGFEYDPLMLEGLFPISFRIKEKTWLQSHLRGRWLLSKWSQMPMDTLEIRGFVTVDRPRPRLEDSGGIASLMNKIPHAGFVA